MLSGDGSDTLAFGYTVLPEDEDADGISVEAGRNSSTGFCFNSKTDDIGLWPASSSSDGMNRIYLGLDDDCDHKVVAVPEEEEDEEVTPPVPLMLRSSHLTRSRSVGRQVHAYRLRLVCGNIQRAH